MWFRLVGSQCGLWVMGQGGRARPATSRPPREARTPGHARGTSLPVQGVQSLHTHPIHPAAQVLGEQHVSGAKKDHPSQRGEGQNYSTSYSRVISHRSTDDAITSLTSEIGRDPVLSGVYGRS